MPHWIDALLLGIVEGLTEFLPVSSTGHLILFGHRLGLHDESVKTLEIVIQLGAIGAVVVAYRRRLAALVTGLVRRNPDDVRLGACLVAGFVPAGIAGLLLHRAIKEHLFGPVPVAAALIVGGFFMIAIEARRARGAPAQDAGLDGITVRQALWIGVAQCFSLWPGTSRSMATIVGGQLSGLTTATAAEFSFLLAIPTLGAATLFDLYRGGEALLADGGIALSVGLAVSFAVALGVIAGFLRYLKRRGLAPFGWYRVGLGLLVLWAMTS